MTMLDRSEKVGDMVVECRRLSEVETLERLGVAAPRTFRYFIAPCLLSPAAASFIGIFVFGVAMLVSENIFGNPPEKRLVWIVPVGFVAGLAFLYWDFYVVPLRDHLILYEKGLAISLRRTRCELQFEEIKGIYVGQAPNWYDKFVALVVRLRHPDLMEIRRVTRKGSVTFERKDGGFVVFNGLLTRFKSEDVYDVIH